MEKSAAMPRYRFYKEVRALEIEAIETVDREIRRISFRDEGFAPVILPEAMFAHYQPVPGDFLVTYGDGYQSVSRRAAFLDGYTKV